jgi:hypothetical protein
VLIAESLLTVKMDLSGCSVISGVWYDPYIAKTFTDPAQLDIDHFVSLAEVYRSGGGSWTPERRQQYVSCIVGTRAIYATEPVFLQRGSASRVALIITSVSS